MNKIIILILSLSLISASGLSFLGMDDREYRYMKEDILNGFYEGIKLFKGSTFRDLFDDRSAIIDSIFGAIKPFTEKGELAAKLKAVLKQMLAKVPTLTLDVMHITKSTEGLKKEFKDLGEQVIKMYKKPLNLTMIGAKLASLLAEISALQDKFETLIDAKNWRKLGENIGKLVHDTFFFKVKPVTVDE